MGRERETDIGKGLEGERAMESKAMPMQSRAMLPKLFLRPSKLLARVTLIPFSGVRGPANVRLRSAAVGKPFVRPSPAPRWPLNSHTRSLQVCCRKVSRSNPRRTTARFGACIRDFASSALRQATCEPHLSLTAPAGSQFSVGGHGCHQTLWTYWALPWMAPSPMNL